MICRKWWVVLVGLAALSAPWMGLAGDRKGAGNKAQPKVGWKKTVVDKEFRSEGVCAADFNKDGKVDIFVGDCWYEAPEWKRHVIRRDKPHDPRNYSESFGCFAEDFNGDGYPDVIVIPFPGKECYWYENPGKAEDAKWKEHLLTTSACNETPIYVDLFKTGKKVLLMGYQPPGSKGNQGELCYFTPGKDPTKQWTRNTVSGPSYSGNEIPGTQRFSHGLGHGDINGDGRFDVIVPQGWWEQPEKVDAETPWKFHAANLGPSCADMYAIDIDGDGKNDVVSSSAHDYGFWWYRQGPGKAEGAFAFEQKNLFLSPRAPIGKSQAPELTREEKGLIDAINKVRSNQKRSPIQVNAYLCAKAREIAEKGRNSTKLPEYAGELRGSMGGFLKENTEKEFLEQAYGSLADLEPGRPYLPPGGEVGVSVFKKEGKLFFQIIYGHTGRFALMAQTHALNWVDMDGDGLKDLVTGRRWWAHGPAGDGDPADPAYLYWFQARKSSTGGLEFIPHLIDDDSGIGTQFAIADMNGDGVPDVIVSNKKGVFVFLQVRAGADPAAPPRRE